VSAFQKLATCPVPLFERLFLDISEKISERRVIRGESGNAPSKEKGCQTYFCRADEMTRWAWAMRSKRDSSLLEIGTRLKHRSLSLSFFRIMLESLIF
jgi:hypothetical protein